MTNTYEEEQIRWYMITTISGKEERVIESLRNRVISENLQSEFEDFKAMLVPSLSEKEYAKKVAGDKFTVKMKNLFPGYIFIKMKMTDDAWFMVRNTQYVTGLVGSSGQRTKPTPVSNLEIRKMEKQVEKLTTAFEAGKIASPFVPGIVVEIIDGPHKGAVATILENNDTKEVATVELILFERKTPTTIAYTCLKIKD